MALAGRIRRGDRVARHTATRLSAVMSDKAGHNPFLLDDEEGFGSLPPPSNHAAAAVKASAPRDPSGGSSRGQSRTASSSALADDGNFGAGAAAGDSKPLLSGSGASNTINIGGATTSATVPSPKPAPQRVKRTSWIFSMQFYQQYFDVDTDDVLARVTHAITRPHAGSFATLHGDNPDLYGPFWICATLIFLNSMGGQYAVYLSRRRVAADGELDWGFDVGKIAASTALFYGYVFLVPLMLYLTLRCFAGVNTSLVGLICAYGYALAVYVPTALLCIVPSELTRWTVYLIGMGISATFLFTNVRPIAAASPKGEAFATPFAGCVVGAHVLFGVMLKLYFFQNF